MTDRSYTAFRLGDVRGVYPADIDETFAFDFAVAFATHFGISGTVATGRDMRTSSKALQQSLDEGFMSCGLEVLDIGLCPTELGYYASARSGISATIVVTASHNPANYNGLKCVLQQGVAVTFETGLNEVMRLMQNGVAPNTTARGHARRLDLHDEYIEYLGRQFPLATRESVKIALNGLNGTAATLAGQISEHFSLPVTWFRREPGPIPDEGADPANPKVASEMKEFMQGDDFQLGVAWDGDCDRCVFFDGAGDIVPTYYIIGLLAEYFLSREPGRAIVYDTKLCWNTLDIVSEFGGKAVASETGHAFMKRHMRENDAIYGGELSSHHFFGNFYYCDSGMFAWLTLLEVLARSGKGIGELIQDRRRVICCTPEISLALSDIDAAFNAVLSTCSRNALSVERFDGFALEMPGEWRFSMKPSKTEPLARVNFESRGNPEQLIDEATKVLDILSPYRTRNEDFSSRLVIQ
jgi:phosphomannomutase